MTGRGWLVLAFTCTTAAAALSTGVPVYYAFAIAGGCAYLLCLLSVLAPVLCTRVSVTCTKNYLQRGEDASILLRLYRWGLLPLGGIVLRIRFSGDEDEREIRFAPYREETITLTFPCPHRGSVRIAVEELEYSDVLSFFRLHRHPRNAECPVLVYPAMHNAVLFDAGSGTVGRDAPSDAPQNDASPSGVREMQEGDSMKRVHWKLSARRGQLLVRTYDELARSELLIVPDVSAIRAPQKVRLTLEDTVCEEALSYANEAMREGYPVRMALCSSRYTVCTGRQESALTAFRTALVELVFDASVPYEQQFLPETNALAQSAGLILITAHLTSAAADSILRLRAGGLNILLITTQKLEEAAAAKLAFAGVALRETESRLPKQK